MKCPYCSKEIHFEEEDQVGYKYDSYDNRITDKINGFIETNRVRSQHLT